MRPNSFFLYLYGFPDSAPTTITQVAQGFYINIPILWCFGAQTSCLISFSLIATFSFLFFLLCSLYYLHFILRLIIEFFFPRYCYHINFDLHIGFISFSPFVSPSWEKQKWGKKTKVWMYHFDNFRSYCIPLVFTLYNLREMKEESRTILNNKIMAVSSLYYRGWFLQMLGWILEWHVGTLNMISSCLFTNLKVLESWLLNQYI